MNEQAIEAVKERIKLGQGREEILKELETVGYSSEASVDLYNAAAGIEPAHIPVPVPTPVPQAQATTAESVVPEANGNSLSSVTPVHKGGVAGIVVLVFVVVLVLSGLVYGVAFGGFQAISSYFGSLTQSAPYETEADMMEGLVSSGRSLTAYGFNFDYQLAIEPREESSPTLSREFFSEGELDEMALDFSGTLAEGNAHLVVSGLIDARNPESPEIDVAATLNVLAEPFILNAAASARVVDGKVYAKIDDIPANFEMFLEGIPLEKWIIMYDENSQFQMPVDPMLPIKAQQALDFSPTGLTQFYVDEITRLLSVSQQVAIQAKERASGQLASGLTAFGLDSNMSKEEALMIERSIELLKKHPPLKFVGEPVEVKGEEGTTYLYSVDLDYDNLRAYALSLVSEAEAITGETIRFTEEEIEEFLPPRNVINEINRLTDIVLTFRPDGSSAGVSVKGIMALDHPDITSQLRLNLDLTYTRQNDALEINIPEEVHSETMQDIITKKMGQAMSEYDQNYSTQVMPEDVSIDDTKIQQALLYMSTYAEELDNYSRVCQDEDMEKMLRALSVAYDSGFKVFVNQQGSNAFGVYCNNNSNGFAIATPVMEEGVKEDQRVWCIDNTGGPSRYRGGILYDKYDVSCD